MTPFDKTNTIESIRDVEGELARYRTLTAVQFTSLQTTLTESQDALSKSRALLGKTLVASVGQTGWLR